MAQGLAEAGADVLIAGRNLEKLQDTAKELNQLGRGKVSAFQTDMGDSDSITALAEHALASLGQVDFLFNNAAPSTALPPMSFPSRPGIRCCR